MTVELSSRSKHHDHRRKRGGILRAAELQATWQQANLNTISRAPHRRVVNVRVKGFGVRARRQQHHRQEAAAPFIGGLRDELTLEPTRIRWVTPPSSGDVIAVHHPRTFQRRVLLRVVGHQLSVLIIRGQIDLKVKLSM